MENNISFTITIYSLQKCELLQGLVVLKTYTLNEIRYLLGKNFINEKSIMSTFSRSLFPYRIREQKILHIESDEKIVIASKKFGAKGKDYYREEITERLIRSDYFINTFEHSR